MGTDKRRPGYWRDYYRANREKRKAANHAYMDKDRDRYRKRNLAHHHAYKQGLRLCRRYDCTNLFEPNKRGRPQLYCSRACKPRDRRTEYQRRLRSPVTPLFPDLAYGNRWSFWIDELAMDLRQEHSLAEVEGRDPNEAVRVYRAREYAWKRITVPLVERGLGAGVPSQANWVNI